MGNQVWLPEVLHHEIDNWKRVALVLEGTLRRSIDELTRAGNGSDPSRLGKNSLADSPG